MLTYLKNWRETPFASCFSERPIKEMFYEKYVMLQRPTTRKGAGIATVPPRCSVSLTSIPACMLLKGFIPPSFPCELLCKLMTSNQPLRG